VNKDDSSPLRPATSFRWIVLALCAYALAWAALNISIVHPLHRESIRIKGPGGKLCPGSVWTAGAPKAVILLGHGIGANQGNMATVADAFARNGYAAVAIDFWGHGRSREKFDWRSNAVQVEAWCRWARLRFNNLPLAYLGHSMGGEAGDRAFRAGLKVDAFVSLGMLPRRIPECKTLVAFGRFEELFSLEQARTAAQGKADVLVSPYSDHAFESVDPVLISGILSWVDKALGFNDNPAFPWGRWSLAIIALSIGTAAIFLLAHQITALVRAKSCEQVVAAPPGALNPFRIAARAFRCSGGAKPPLTKPFFASALRGIAFGLAVVLLLSLLISANIYTCWLDQPERCLTWLVAFLALTPLSLFIAGALERFPFGAIFRRFAVAALTWAVPLTIIGLALQRTGPGIAFLGMMLGLLAGISIFISAVYAIAVHAAQDYRAGGCAASLVLAWSIAFCFPLSRGF
jgi:dienelactone hydrolase